MLKGRRKQMIDAIYIVLIFKDSRELPNDLGISLGRVHFCSRPHSGDACIIGYLPTRLPGRDA